MGFTDEDGEFIKLKVVAGRRSADSGCVHLVGKDYLDEYGFSLRAPVTGRRAEARRDAGAFYQRVLGTSPDAWLGTDECEVLVVTGVSAFVGLAEGIKLELDSGEKAGLHDLLCAARAEEKKHGKLLVTHSRGHLAERSHVAILDGLEALQANESIQAPNVLVLLERSEYRESANNLVLQLRGSSERAGTREMGNLLQKYPPGLELAAFELAWP